MAKLDHLIEELVTANRILAREGVVDSFGHISVRHPDNPQHYLLSRSRAPDCIESDDIMEFTLDGAPVDARGRAPYLERFIHGALYEARSGCDVGRAQSQRKRHPVRGDRREDQADLPHGRVDRPRGAGLGFPRSFRRYRVAGREHGDGPRSREADRRRRHGADARAMAQPWRARNIRHAVYVSVYLEVNARLQKQAMDMGEIKFLTAGEVDEGRVAHRLLRHQSGLGELVPAGRPPVPGRAGLSRQLDQRHPQRHNRAGRASCHAWAGCAIRGARESGRASAGQPRRARRMAEEDDRWSWPLQLCRWNGSTRVRRKLASADAILAVDDIVKRFETPDGVLVAVDHVSLSRRAGRISRRDRPLRLRQVDACST